MGDEIISLHAWCSTPAGRYLLDWEGRRFAAAQEDIFGYHGVQLGLPAFDGLASSRVRRTWCVASPDEAAEAGSAVAGSRRPASLVADFAALPFESGSLDMVLMPHALDLAVDPHSALREAERVLVADGKLVICGFNPASLWGLSMRRQMAAAQGGPGLSQARAREGIGYWRLRDWLRLLSFEVESGQFGIFRPPVRSERWLERWSWLDRAGDRWWPIFGAAYFVVASKRVVGMHRLAPPWKPRSSLRREPAAVAVAGRDNAAPRRGPVLLDASGRPPASSP